MFGFRNDPSFQYSCQRFLTCVTELSHVLSCLLLQSAASPYCLQLSKGGLLASILSKWNQQTPPFQLEVLETLTISASPLSECLDKDKNTQRWIYSTVTSPGKWEGISCGNSSWTGNGNTSAILAPALQMVWQSVTSYTPTCSLPLLLFFNGWCLWISNSK